MIWSQNVPNQEAGYNLKLKLSELDSIYPQQHTLFPPRVTHYTLGHR